MRSARRKGDSATPNETQPSKVETLMYLSEVGHELCSYIVY